MEALSDSIVVSTDGTNDVQAPNSPFAKRADKLPQDRKGGARPLYVEKKGYLTAKQVNALLDLHRDQAKEWPVERLAQEFSLDVAVVQNLVQYSVRPVITKEGPGQFSGR